MFLLKDKKLDKIVKALREGKTVVFPTETSYGLGCDAASQEAVNKIFKIKGRIEDKPLLAAVPSVAMAKKYLLWNNTIDRLAKKFWLASPKLRRSGGGPGPLTIVGQGNGLAKGVIAADNTIAVRVTDHPVLKFLAEKLGRPVVATSANLSGAPALYDAQEIIAAFAEKKWQPDFILDYGTLPKNLPSTIVSVAGDRLKIIRQGELKIPPKADQPWAEKITNI